MSKQRWRIGARRWVANFFTHNGNIDQHGQPTTTETQDWIIQVSGWPVELVATSGGEYLRGRQVTAETTHVLFGEAFGAEGVEATQRCEVDGTLYGVVSVLDLDGLNREKRVELKREVN